MNIKPKKELRDPIHGFIPIYDHEFEIIQDPVFQRLRNIKQLSFGYLVYHGAEHSRFGHVLGVMHLAEKALNKINDNAQKLNTPSNITEDDIRLARFAALLHDVGHHPFSHALDDPKIIPRNHEDYSKILVENHFEKPIKKAGLDPKDVTDLILGKPNPEKPFLSDLIHSQIDVDRCDYLLRDSHYSGVKYGIYDLDRFLDSLFVTEDKRLVILNKGFFAAEQFIMARYQMFSQIYLHKTKRCFENLTKKLCIHLLELGEFDYPSPESLSSTKSIENFITMDDSWLLKKITDVKTSSMENIVKSIKLRDPYKVVLDSEKIGLKMLQKNEGQDGSSYCKGIEENLQYELEQTDNLKNLGIEKEDIIFDEAKKLSYKLRPYAFPLAGQSQEDPHTIFIYDDETKSKEPIEFRSKLIKILGESIQIRRTYVKRDKHQVLLDHLKNKHPDLI
ncbi:MAG: HD domain-containing protein [Thaumarchaeota archaeon]|nr:HD domain-containing protein [Nitrososphaerota archaeon]